MVLPAPTTILERLDLMRNHHRLPGQRHYGRSQRGAILMVSLIFLVILTLIGISAMSTTTFEEKMAGSSRDWNLAFAAAEAAIRDAEYDITSKYLPNQATAVRPGGVSGLSGFGDETDNENNTCSISGSTFKEGLCRRNAGQPTTVATFTSTDTFSVSYGTYTGAVAAGYLIKGVSQQPRYIITGFKTGLTGKDISKPVVLYEITARGFGSNPNTQVTLREVFRVPD